MLTLVFSYSLKDAAVYSIFTIFFGQLSKLSSMYINGDFVNIDFRLLLIFIPLSIIGGIVGTNLNKRFSNNNVQKFFLIITVIIIVINVLNIIKFFVKF